jgi:hypothetical protein
VSCSSSRRLLPLQSICNQLWIVTGSTNVVLSMWARVPGRKKATINCTAQVYTNWRAIHNSRPDIVVLDKTVKAAKLIDVAVANSHNFYCTITEKLHKCTDFTEELITIWQQKTACTVPPVLFTAGIIPNKRPVRYHRYCSQPVLFQTNGLYSTTGTVHSRYYSKQITRQFETAQSPPCSIHRNGESSNT